MYLRVPNKESADFKKSHTSCKRRTVVSVLSSLKNPTAFGGQSQCYPTQENSTIKSHFPHS